MTASKRSVFVTFQGQRQKISFYEGTSELAIDRAVRAAFGIAESVTLRFRDTEGDALALCDKLPHELELTAEATELVTAQKMQTRDADTERSPARSEQSPIPA